MMEMGKNTQRQIITLNKVRYNCNLLNSFISFSLSLYNVVSVKLVSRILIVFICYFFCCSLVRLFFFISLHPIEHHKQNVFYLFFFLALLHQDDTIDFQDVGINESYYMLYMLQASTIAELCRVFFIPVNDTQKNASPAMAQLFNYSPIECKFRS